MKRIVRFVSCALFGLGFVAISLPAEAAVFVATNDWFTLDASALTSITTNGAAGSYGTWTAVPPSGDVSLSDGEIDLDTDYENPLTYKLTDAYKTTESSSRTTIKMVATECDALPTLSDAPIALCVYTGTDSKTAWYAYVNSTWQELTKSYPTVGAEYEVRIDVDTSASTVQLWARTGTADFTALSDAISVTGLTSQFSSVSFYGSTTLGDFVGQTIRTSTIETDNPENVEVVAIEGAQGGSVFVDKSTDRWTKSIGDSHKNEPNATASNGYTYLQNYVLGLDSSSSTSKPIVQSVQDTTTDKVTFKLGGVNVDTTSGAKVQYVVKSYSSLSSATATATSSSTETSEQVTMDLPTTDSVRYYKVEVSVK